MVKLVSLLADSPKISRQEFKVRLNEIHQGLPQNLGRAFFDWWSEAINEKCKAKIGFDVTPGIVGLWLVGNGAPCEALRPMILAAAHKIVKGDEMSEKEFLTHVRYCKGVMNKHFLEKDPELIAWANDYFFHRICLETPAELEAAQAWFVEVKRPWEFVPRQWLRMMTVRAVANAAEEAIARDRFNDHQQYA